jgi:serine/threonine protein phosphatase PrpC
MARGGLRVTAAAATRVGAVRVQNADAVWLDVERGRVLVIDGGGEQGLAAQAMIRALAASRDHLRDALMAGARAVAKLPNDPDAWEHESATIAAIELGERTFTVLHCGDVRAYLVRSGRARAVTRDHDLAREAEDAGATPEVIAEVRARYASVLTACLGLGTERIDVCEIPVEPGDRLLLACDGVHRHLDDARLAALVEGRVTAETAERILDEALTAGSKDNVSVAVVEILGMPS